MTKKAKRPSWFKLWLHHKSLVDAVPDEVAGRAIKAALAYFATGEVVDLGQLETVVFAAIKSDIDEANTDYLRDVENGKKGGRPKIADEEKPPVKGGNPPQPTVPQGDGEGERDRDGKDVRADKPPAPAKREARKSYGSFGWVKLTDEEYDRLLNDLGQAETERCIAYVDESAQSTGNKNKWKDWNLVLRKCNKQGWGLNQRQQQRNIRDNESGMDRLARMYGEEFTG